MRTLGIALAGALALATFAQAAVADVPLATQLAAERKVHPDVVAAVERVRAEVAAHPPDARGSVAVGWRLRALGEQALVPMLALVATSETSMKELPVRSRRALLVGLLEAIGGLKDARAASTLRALLDGPEADAQVAATAASALGKLCRPEDAAFLVGRAVPGHARDRAAIAGLAECRREEVVTHLAARLDAHPDDATAVALAESLGSLGSSWAWQALAKSKLAASAEPIRTHAATALASAFVAYGGATRDAIGRALVMVEHPAARARLQALRGGVDPATAAAIEALEGRLP